MVDKFKVAYLADQLFGSNQGGITRYTRELARQLMEFEEIDLNLFSQYTPTEMALRTEQNQALPAIQSSVPRIPRAAQYLLWHYAGLAGPVAHAIDGADIVHSPTLWVPPRRTAPLVVTVHDISFISHPHYHTGRVRLIYNSGLRRAIREADALITDAVCTADEMVRLAGAPRHKIFPIPLAADASFRPTFDPAVPSRYGIESDYLLYVGTLEPRKNLTVLLEAFAGLDTPGIKLVLAGAKGWLYEEIFTSIDRLQLQERVIFPGYVADGDLAALYTMARVFVYPSTFEGFGLPVLEAMACGTPVITTNVSSLPEVAGDAAILISPDDIPALRQALRSLLSDQALHTELSGRALARSKEFSWRKTAEMTAEIYRNVLHNRVDSNQRERHFPNRSLFWKRS